MDNLLRICVKDYKVPNSQHTIERGTLITIPVYAIHHDPEIYPNPEIFDPDRFTENNIKNRHNFAWIPFGEGPRSCVGMQLGILQTKIGLAHLLLKYRFKTSPKTPIPLVIDPKCTVASPKCGMWLAIEKI